MRKLLIIMLLGVMSQPLFAQNFEISAELRPRLEYRNGYKTLTVDSLDAASFVSQRTRLNLGYGSEKINMYLSIQDVRVWGDVPTLNTADANGTSIHEAWAELLFTPEFSLKLGRQEISYDDQRIFGAVGWAQQARSHDALLAIYKPNTNNHFELGLALNASSESLFETIYALNNYKSLQYIWYHTQLSPVNLSFLALNNGLAFIKNGKQEVDYNQTFGAYAKLAKSPFNAEASLYFQTGKIADQPVQAYNVSLNGSYTFKNGLKPGLGVEYLSGTDMDATNSDSNSFNPWYGTNHKFNGWMDYFYVGNHINSVGLVDVYANITYTKNKFSVSVIPHMFSSAATVTNSLNEDMDAYLGTEIDLALTYKWTKDVSFQAGYSQMFATDTMAVLKGGNANATTNWAWAMITIKPSLFKTSFKSNE
ncbi:alginate export family protein [Bizionia hallyeonensis]|uniref:Alginate export family protein n=1 Tax=Bizionia hallyeonensis TaxID=1123757 RepID=A0ABW0C8G7_9FLAO